MYDKEKSVQVIIKFVKKLSYAYLVVLTLVIILGLSNATFDYEVQNLINLMPANFAAEMMYWKRKLDKDLSPLLEIANTEINMNTADDALQVECTTETENVILDTYHHFLQICLEYLQ